MSADKKPAVLALHPSSTAAVRCKHEGYNKMVSSVEPLFLPLSEGFSVMGVGRTKGYQLVKEGKIKVVKIGRKSLTSVASLRSLADALIEEAARAA